MKIIHLLFYWVLVFGTTNILAQTIVVTDLQTGLPIVGNKYPNEVKYRVTDLPNYPPSRGAANMRWKCMWDFGDCTAPSMKDAPTHRYEKPGKYQVKLILTPIYSDHEDLDIAYFPDAHNTFEVTDIKPPTITNRDPNFSAGSYLSLEDDRAPVPGSIYSLITYYLNPMGNSPFSGKLLIEFDPEIYVFSHKSYKSCKVATPSLQGLPYGILLLDFSTMKPGEFGTELLNFKVKKDAPLEAVSLFKISLLDAFSVVIDDKTLEKRVVDSHDPNLKLVSKEVVCNNEELKYSIHFENLGNGPAYDVFILDEVDEELLMDSFDFIGTSYPGLSTQIIHEHDVLNTNFNPFNYLIGYNQGLYVILDDTNRKVAFCFKDILLQPKQEAMLEYNLTTDLPQIPVRDQFGGPAEVFFDNNEGILTSPGITQLGHCRCVPSGLRLPNQYLLKVDLDGHEFLSGDDGGFLEHPPINLPANTNLPFSLEALSSTSDDLTFVAYLDTNQDDTFQLSEKIWETTIASTYSGSGPGKVQSVSGVLVLNALVGTSRALRFGYAQGGTPIPCTNAPYGEFEETTLHFIDSTWSDLSFLHSKLLKEKLIEGDRLKINYSISNSGAGSNSVSLKAYLSTDLFWDEDDDLLFVETVPVLAEGDLYFGSLDVLPPEEIDAGTYYCLLQIDPADSLIEKNEFNNEIAHRVKVNRSVELPPLSPRLEAIDTQHEKPQPATIELFPNPVRSSQQIQVTLKGLQHFTTLQLTDLLGRSVAYELVQQTIENQQMVLLLQANFDSSGCYLLTMSNHDLVLTKKVVVF